ncbi:hypothetical protein [Metabacillus fastidiosus]|uniref:hypothetical protein n=1 Tax=Metabacillus fastidiosus TaxID=1458 RepID=UPI003D2B8EB6
MISKKVVVEYKTKRDYCHCCNQKLPEAKVSEMRKFELSKENFLEWTDDWDEIAKYDDLGCVVEEFVYETIDFYTTSSYESIVIDGSEFDKINQFVLNELITK